MYPRIIMSWSPCFLTLLLLISLASSSASYIPSLSLPRDDLLLDYRPNELASDDDFKVFFHNQTLDHFNYRPESYMTFPQKYVINSKYWGGPNSSAPIFAYLGAEAPINGEWNFVGFLTENAPRFKALLLYIEHRFYGDSDPTTSVKDPNVNGYFSSSQALADYAEVILHVKKKLHAENSPVIVVGASYGGMLAAYFRLKYPHIAYAALASSAPVMLFNNFVPHYGYFDIVTKDFKHTSQNCYDTITRSWTEIDRVASEPDGLVKLSKTFQTCQPLSDADELKESLVGIYAFSAQYNRPAPNQNWLGKLCGAIDNSGSNTSILIKILNGVIALEGNSSCHINRVEIKALANNQTVSLGWFWQRCTEFLYSLARGNNTMFQPDPAPLQLYVDSCMSLCNVAPRPYWVPTYYGGQDIKSALREFGSNIIFANGLADPFSNGGILEDLSPTLRAVYTVNGSHCLDLVPSRADDPEWLVKQRKTEINLMTKWINKYYADLQQA